MTNQDDYELQSIVDADVDETSSNSTSDMPSRSRACPAAVIERFRDAMTIHAVYISW